MRADAAGSAQAAQAAAERARREAAESARREAAERARREAAAAQQHQRPHREAAPTARIGLRREANERPRKVLETLVERTGIDTNFVREHFQTRFRNGEAPRLNLQDAVSRRDRTPEPPARDDSVRVNRSFFEKGIGGVRDLYRNVAEGADGRNLLARAASGARNAWESVRNAANDKPQNNAATPLKIIDMVTQAARAVRTIAAAAPPPPAPDRILASSRDGDSATATRTLRKELENIKGTDAPEKRAALINDPKVKEALGNVGRDLMTRDYDTIYSLPQEELKRRVIEINNSFSDLSRAAEIAGKDGARTIAESFVRDVATSEPGAENLDQFSRIGLTSLTSTGLQQAIESGDGASFAVNLTFAFKRAGNEYVAGNIAANVEESLKTVREDFTDKAEKVEELNGKLARLLAGFSPMLKAEQQQQAIGAFKKQNADEYGEFEDAGKILASTLNGAKDIISLPRDCDEANAESVSSLQGEATEILKNLPRIGQTEPGQKAIADAMEKQGADESTFMDLVPGIAQKTKDAAKYTGDVANLATKAVGARVVQLAADGREQDAAKLFLGLKKNYQLFGINRDSMNGIAGDMRRVMISPAGSPEKIAAQRSLEERFSNVGGGTPGLEPNGRASQALRGLGLVVSIAGNADSWKKIDEQKLTDQIRTVGGSLGIGVDGGTLALDILGKDNSAAKLLGKTGVGLGGISAVLDGITAIDDFKNGKYAKGVLSSASAAGGAILAVAAAYSAAGAVQVVPLWGQIAGGVLVLGATIGNFALGKHYEHQDEADAKAFLQGAGLPEPAADALSDLTSDRENVGPFIQQVAPFLGVSSGELLRHLAKLDEGALNDIVEMSHDLESNDRQKYEGYADNDDEVGEMRLGINMFGGSQSKEVLPESLYGAARWMTKHGYSPSKVELPPPNQGDFELLLNPPYA